jgi:hypothetical protein
VSPRPPPIVLRVCHFCPSWHASMFELFSSSSFLRRQLRRLRRRSPRPLLLFVAVAQPTTTAAVPSPMREPATDIMDRARVHGRSVLRAVG